jgi:hypothetical protein
MNRIDKRSEHLGWVETALQAANPTFPDLSICGQSHYGPSNRFAFIDVFGVDQDRFRRRQIRLEANDMLRCLGYAVELEPGRDVYGVTPLRPTAEHDRMRMLQSLHAACDRLR